jgi:hypothetical protein
MAGEGIGDVNGDSQQIAGQVIGSEMDKEFQSCEGERLGRVDHRGPRSVPAPTLPPRALAVEGGV